MWRMKTICSTWLIVFGLIIYYTTKYKISVEGHYLYLEQKYKNIVNIYFHSLSKEHSNILKESLINVQNELREMVDWEYAEENSNKEEPKSSAA